MTRTALGALVLCGVAATGFGLSHGIFRAAAPPGAPVSGLDPGTVAPAAPLRLAFLGTSLTHGRTWPDEVTAALRACRAGAVTARVVARPGATSVWGLSALADALADAPHILLVEFAINDASIVRGVSLARSRRTHEAIAARAKASGAAVVFVTMSGAVGPEALERPGLAAYHGLYREMAAARRGGLVDLAPLWAALPASVLRDALPDGLHPSDAAMRRVAVPALRDALAAAVCARASEQTGRRPLPPHAVRLAGATVQPR